MQEIEGDPIKEEIKLTKSSHDYITTDHTQELKINSAKEFENSYNLLESNLIVDDEHDLIDAIIDFASKN